MKDEWSEKVPGHELCLRGMKRQVEVVGMFIILFTKTFEQWKKPGCLGFIGDYTTQLCGDYKKPW